MSQTLKKAMIAGVGIFASLSLAACGGSAPSTASDIRSVMSATEYNCDAPDNSTTTDVSITMLPIVSTAAIYAGIDQGFFEKNGLNVEISTVASAPAATAAVQGGTANFAFSATVADFQAIDQGIPLTIVAPFAGISPGYWDKMQAGEEGYTTEITALLVGPNSTVDNPGQLDGKTIAVGDAKGQAELTTRYVIKEHGGDPDSVKFVVMSFADAANALMAGQVDAAYSVNPIMAPALAQGAKVISWAGVETFHEGPTSAIVASNQWVMDNPETVARFNCALQESAEYANDNHDAVRAAAAKAQGVDPATLANATVPYFFSSIDMEGLQRFLDISKSMGFVKGDFDIADYVIPQAVN